MVVSLVNSFIDSSKIDDDLFVLDVDLGLKKEAENISFWYFQSIKWFYR